MGIHLKNLQAYREVCVAFEIDITELWKEHKCPELQNALCCISQARAMTGKLYGLLGEETPYKNDGERKTVEDIEEDDAENYKGIIPITHNWNSEAIISNPVPLVDEIREKISIWFNSDIYHQVKVEELSPNQSLAANVYWIEVVKNGELARIWLGFFLGKLRDKNA